MCAYLQTISNRVHLIILQHPSESKHALNTVRIMKKSFEKITVILGEDFSTDAVLHSILAGPHNQCALLYPAPHAVYLNLNHFSSSPIAMPTHLILIDGTWRKAKKIFILSKGLHHLPAFKLAPAEKSHYRIRKTPEETALSTLEASVYALKFLEPALDTGAALDSFHKMIDKQIEKMGKEVYETYYLKKR